MPETVTRSRRGRLLRFATALVVLLAVGAYARVQYLNGGGGDGAKCVVHAAGGASASAAGTSGGGVSYKLTPEQAANAATIAAVGISKGMPERAVTIALATALQESMLLNLKHGDRDSLGLFQQRPSTGWGSAQQILDPVYSATQFYQRLAKVPGYSRLPLTVAAQRVQRSGFPQAYAKHEPDATVLAAAFTGRAPALLTCPKPPMSPGTGDPAKVRKSLVKSFGPKVLPTVRKPQGVGSGVVEVSPSPKSTAGVAPAEAAVSSPVVISVPVDDIPGADGGGHGESAGAAAPQRGWEVAHWAVAQATALGIERVAFGDRVWSAAHAPEGWQRIAQGGAASTSSTATVRITVAQ